jgi:glutamyl-Q tRNA(Asp) synthetase
VHWSDQRLGAQSQDVATEVGDFILQRADGLWAYQLAVVVDDAAQGITQVVRGEDLADNTPRQILLQQALGLPTPVYRHTPLVLGDNGEKLSKQNGAQALDLSDPLAALNRAARSLGLPATQGTVTEALTLWAQHPAMHTG